MRLVIRRRSGDGQRGVVRQPRTRRLAGLFATPLTWRILDGFVAVTIIALGASLVIS